MKRLFRGFLVIGATCATSVSAQTSYIVSEKALSPRQTVIRSNEAGWYVVEGSMDSSDSLFLNGPKGYSRDIREIAPARSVDGTLTLDSAYVAAVDGSGAVYFAQNVFQASGGADPTYLGSVVKKLALNTNNVVDFYSDINDPQKVLRSVFAINTQGHLVKLQNILSGTQKQVVLKKFVNGVESEHSIPFSEVASDRNVLDILEVDSTGGFTVYRRAIRPARRGRGGNRSASLPIITGLCTGTTLSPSISCYPTDALNKQGFMVAGMSGGTVVMSRTNMRTARAEYARFDPDSFAKKSSFSIPQSLGYSSVALAANGDIHNLRAGSPLGTRRFQLVTDLEAGGRRRIACTVKRKVSFDDRTSDGEAVQALSDGGLLIFGGRSDRPTVLELTPARASDIPTDAAGRCDIK